jgi:hypothetical protein
MNFTTDRDNVLREYKYGVIAKTPFDYDPPVAKGKRPVYRLRWDKAQIIIVETTGDQESYPLEVGTWAKPGKIGYRCIVVGSLPDAVNLSYAIADEVFELGENEYTWDAYDRWKRERKNLRQANRNRPKLKGKKKKRKERERDG